MLPRHVLDPLVQLGDLFAQLVDDSQQRRRRRPQIFRKFPRRLRREAFCTALHQRLSERFAHPAHCIDHVRPNGIGDRPTSVTTTPAATSTSPTIISVRPRGIITVCASSPPFSPSFRSAPNRPIRSSPAKSSSSLSRSIPPIPPATILAQPKPWPPAFTLPVF